MKRAIIITILSIVALGACSSSSGQGEAVDVTTAAAPTTTGASTSTSTTSTTTTTVVVQTTVEPAFTREAEVAVRRCVEAWRSIGLSFMLGGVDDAEAVREACDEARVQLDVEDHPDAPLISLRIAEAVLAVSMAAGDVVIAGTFDAEAAAVLDRENNARAAEIEDLLD